VKRALFASLPLAGGCLPSCGPCPVDTRRYYSDMGPDASCEQLCAAANRIIVSCSNISEVDGGLVAVDCETTYACGTGRRPTELVRASVDGDVVGRWLAEAAQLEAASVPAFEIVARELRAHDAPAALIARALESADDERRHARIMTSLARAYGATPGPVRVIVREPRDLEAIARENVVEGLVREAYGARVAIDPAIAADELRHAELAAFVHDWIRPRLPYAARRRVDEARAAARAQLVADCAVEPAPALRHALGLPDATRAVELAHLI